MSKVIFIASTGGSVLNAILSLQQFRKMTLAVITDRDCGAVKVAKKHGVEALILKSDGDEGFSEKLKIHCEELDVIFISFYTKKLESCFLSSHPNKVFNCHPSLLPIAKGLNGFDDTLSSNTNFLGCSLHVVRNEIDSGQSVIQGCIPLNRSLPNSVNRHKVFLMQVYSLMQFLLWYKEKRIHFNDNINVDDVKFMPSIFSPNLDSNFFEMTNMQNELARMQND